jgi:hypothetical protein
MSGGQGWKDMLKQFLKNKDSEQMDLSKSEFNPDDFMNSFFKKDGGNKGAWKHKRAILLTQTFLEVIFVSPGSTIFP